jgi:uncharacterized membrane protein YhhN
MSVFWLVIVLAVALADWISISRGLKRVGLFTKPAVLLLLILWSLVASKWNGDMLWFGLALVFSLAGDILLMLPRRFFLVGLLAFLGTHICYLLGINSSPSPLPQDTYLYFIPIAAISFFVARRINQAVPVASAARMRIPIIAYSIVIGLMVYSALNTLLRPDWQSSAAVLISLGAGFFLFSDVFLAYDHFIQPFKNARLIVRITYHLGQIAIISAALAHFNAF